MMSCCEPQGSELPEHHDCPDCGEPVDINGDALEVCGFSPVECDTCGVAICDQGC